MAIDKQHILNEIKRVAKANGGKAPGKQKFTSETGIKESDWYPRHWLRWSDALWKSGLSPNEMETAWIDEVLLEKYIGLIRELKHIPVVVSSDANQRRILTSQVIQPFADLEGKPSCLRRSLVIANSALDMMTSSKLAQGLPLKTNDLYETTESHQPKKSSVLYTS